MARLFGADANNYRFAALGMTLCSGSHRVEPFRPECRLVVSGEAQFCVLENGEAQVCSLQMRTRQKGLVEIGSGQVRFCQVCSQQICARKVSPGQIRTR